MEPALLGALLICASLALYVFAEGKRRLAGQALGTELTTAGELAVLHAMVAAQVGSGLFAHPVALQGTLHCEQPLQSDLTHTPCAAFRYRMERRWQEEYEDRDAHGGRVWRVREGSDLVATNERRTPFWLHDESGRVLVNPMGASLEMEKIADRFEPAEPERGSYRRPLLPAPPARGRRHTLGYHLREEILPLERTIYVLGLATDRDGALTIGAAGFENLFLISVKTREQVLHEARRTMTLARYGAFICALAGLLLLVLALLFRR